jgi:hypothetical protein
LLARLSGGLPRTELAAPGAMQHCGGKHGTISASVRGLISIVGIFHHGEAHANHYSWIFNVWRREETMRVCVIGTSNAIFKDGYCGAIASDSRVTKFEKYCIGASPSLIIPYFCEKIDFSLFDFVVFDTAINDANYYKYGSMRKDQIRQFLEFGIHCATKSGCKPVLLVMPSRRSFSKPTMSRVIYNKVAAENGLPILDGFDFSVEFSKRNNVELGSLFADDFHLEKSVARVIGNLLVDKMENFPKGEMPDVKLKSRFYSVKMADFYSSRKRSTSIASANLVEATENPMIFEIPSGHEVAGVVYNSSKTSGSLRIGEGIVKSLWTKYYGNAKDLLMIMAPVVGKDPVGKNGTLAVSLATTEDSVSETSRFEHIRADVPETLSVELESLVIRERLKH